MCRVPLELLSRTGTYESCIRTVTSEVIVSLVFREFEGSDGRLGRRLRSGQMTQCDESVEQDMNCLSKIL